MPGAGPERGDVVGGAVGVGAALAVPGDQAVDQRAGCRAATDSKSRPSRAQRAGPDVGEENVCAAEQFERGRASVVGRQVEHDAALGAVVHLERRARPRSSMPSIRPNIRAGSPSGGSILTTSAPQSARIPPAAGPATHTPSSTTLTPSNGPAIGIPSK